MEDKVYSNAVASFSRQQMLADVIASDIDEDDDETYGDEYLKAIDGTFDESYFKDHVTGRFCLPNYNKDWKGLVKVKDITQYKDSDFAWARREEKRRYTIDDFEKKFPFVVFEVQEFPEFLGKLPAACFNKGISKDNVIELFDEYEYVILGRTRREDCIDFYDDRQPAIDTGLLEIVDMSHKTEAERWGELEPATLREICDKHGLSTSRNSAPMIRKLIAEKVKFPYQALRPTELLLQCHALFVDLYIDQIRTNADHFHPLYLKDLWEEVAHVNYLVESLEQKVNQILKNPYWEDRFCKAVEFSIPTKTFLALLSKK